MIKRRGQSESESVRQHEKIQKAGDEPTDKQNPREKGQKTSDERRKSIEDENERYLREHKLGKYSEQAAEINRGVQESVERAVEGAEAIGYAEGLGKPVEKYADRLRESRADLWRVVNQHFDRWYGTDLDGVKAAIAKIDAKLADAEEYEPLANETEEANARIETEDEEQSKAEEDNPNNARNNLTNIEAGFFAAGQT